MTRAVKSNLRKEDAHRVKTAEMWLIMGKPLRALTELQRLTHRAWKHPRSEQILWRAAQCFA
ncbi:MAG TPA: hypothetical protein VL793_12105 [Patescibacteria group bacterium]|nr:hypothetical protein [Patescibacteria group bacterium]